MCAGSASTVTFWACAAADENNPIMMTAEIPSELILLRRTILPPCCWLMSETRPAYMQILAKRKWIFHFVILSEVMASQREAIAQSKDLCKLLRARVRRRPHRIHHAPSRP
jgi:hypothetical protein